MQVVIYFSEKFEKILQKVKHRMCSIIVIPPPKQWSGGSVHQTCKMYNKNALILNQIYI